MANRRNCDRGQPTGTILIPVVLVILLLWMDYNKRHTGPRFPHAPSNFKEGYCRGQHHRNRAQLLPSEVILDYLDLLFDDEDDIQMERVLGKVPETGEFDLVVAGLEGQEVDRAPGSEGTEGIRQEKIEPGMHQEQDEEEQDEEEQDEEEQDEEEDEEEEGGQDKVSSRLQDVGEYEELDEL